MRISDWSSDVCSSDLLQPTNFRGAQHPHRHAENQRDDPGQHRHPECPVHAADERVKIGAGSIGSRCPENQPIPMVVHALILYGVISHPPTQTAQPRKRTGCAASTKPMEAAYL